MCCDLCDHYYKCDEVDRQPAICCGKCAELDDCHGEMAAGRQAKDDEYDDFLEDDDDEVFDDDDDDDDYDDDYDEDFPDDDDGHGEVRH